MTTHYATSRDQSRIAYDVSGDGPVLMLLHGGGQTRRVWHQLGYVDRLRDQFTVVSVDLRGNGESDKPTARSAYDIDRLSDDLLAVADAIAAERLMLWGYSYGANVGRYLAARSDRVSAIAIVGIPFGPAASGPFRQMILDLSTKWSPIVQASAAGTLDLHSLPEADRATWQRGTVPLNLAWLTAMLDWPTIEPEDIRCRTLWVVGSSNTAALDSVRAHEQHLDSTTVAVDIVQGLNHEQELTSIDEMLPRIEKFATRV